MSGVNVVIIGSFPEEIQAKMRGAFPGDWCVQIAAPEAAEPFLSSADVIIPEHVPVNRTLLEKSPNLKMIQTGSGYDNVDLEECRRREITVCTAAGVNAAAVAEHTMALMLAWYKNIPYLDHCLKSHERWESVRYSGSELSELTAGIVGTGRIGRKTAALCQAFGMRVLTFSRHRKVFAKAALPDPETERSVFQKASSDAEKEPSVLKEMSSGPEAVDFDTLLRESDVISIHVPLNEETKGMFHKETFAKMKKTAVLVNTSRGGVVQEEDLTEALQKGAIGGACLDVFSQEPLPEDSPLRDLPNVILTPHTAGLPDGAHYHAKRYAFFAENIRRFMSGEEPAQPAL